MVVLKWENDYKKKHYWVQTGGNPTDKELYAACYGDYEPAFGGKVRYEGDGVYKVTCYRD